MMKSLMVKTLERVINQHIALDLEHETLMQPLLNKPLSLVLEDWRLTLTLTPQDHPAQFKLSLKSEDRAPTFIQGKMADLFPLVFANSLPAALMSSQIQISGQIHTLDAYQTFFKQLDMDLEVALAKHMSPTLARALILPFKSVKTLAKRHLHATKQDLPEWLQEEANLLPSKARIEDFYQDLQHMREHLDRLEARVRHISEIKKN